MVKKIMKGVAASMGITTGNIFIINTHEDFSRFPEGAILVAEKTDPSYVPLFFKAKAVITELGGLTSHAAIISRELGIPCVLNVKNARRLLQQGQKVVVDGTNGQIYTDA